MGRNPHTKPLPEKAVKKYVGILLEPDGSIVSCFGPFNSRQAAAKGRHQVHRSFWRVTELLEPD